MGWQGLDLEIVGIEETVRDVLFRFEGDPDDTEWHDVSWELTDDIKAKYTFIKITVERKSSDIGEIYLKLTNDSYTHLEGYMNITYEYRMRDVEILTFKIDDHSFGSDDYEWTISKMI